VSKVYTTGSIAKMCQVAPKTVAKWFDSGELEGYLIPQSKDRRVPSEAILSFIKKNRMPIPEELRGSNPRVLLVGTFDVVRGGLSEYIGRDFDIEFAASGFEAGVYASENPPQCVVVDSILSANEVVAIVDAFKGKKTTVLGVGFGPNDESEFQETFQKPVETEVLAARISHFMEGADD